MKRILLISLLLVPLFTFAQPVTFEWAKSVGGQNYDDCNSIVLDNQGNVYVTGRFQKFVGTEVDFDPGPGVYNIAAIGQFDAFVLKLNSSGEFLWARNFGGAGAAVSGNGITVDSNGNVYTTGTFSYSIDFDPSPTSEFILNSINQFGNAATDIFVSKLDSNGNFVWAKRIGAQFFDEGFSITSDSTNKIYVSGKFAGTVNFNTNGGIYELNGISSSSGFILKMDADANFEWATSVSGSGGEAIYSTTVDNSGNVFAVGNFVNTTDINPGTAVYNLEGSGIYVLKLDIVGNFIFAKGFTGIVSSKAIKVDAIGNIYTTGSFQETVDFDPGIGIFNMEANGATTGQDVFLSKLDNFGNFAWAKKIYSTSPDFSRSLELDSLGNIYIAPNLGLSLFNIDNGPAIIGSISNPDLMAVLKFNSSGTLLAKNFISSTSELKTNGISVDSNFNVYTCGNFVYTVDFNPDTPLFNLTANALTDAYISKIKLVNEVLNTEGNNFSDKLLLYPNPSTDNLIINTSREIYNGSLKIFSLTGQLVFEQRNLSGIDFNINVANFNQGLYLLQISDGTNTYNSKFIKK